MSAGPHPTTEWPPRSHAWVLLACALGVVAHQWVRWDWFIDDSAIVFAYARNIADGLGIVPWPGGERIEAFSDPTWLALFVGFELIGYNGFQIAKPLSMIFTVLCLPVAYGLARDAQPGRDTLAPLIAPVFLALNAQVAIWSASALENSLFFLLMLLAVRATPHDAETGRFPRSALWFLLLAWTRPDGLIYAAIGGAWYLGLVLRAGHGLRPVAWWLAAFWGPYGLAMAWRWWYFAWPLPNTYYAKLETRENFPLEWTGRGWTQLRDYAARLWQGYLLPVYLAGLVGLRGRRCALAFASVALLASTLLWPGTDALRGLWFWPALPMPPAPLLKARVVAFGVVAAALPWAALGQRRGGGVLGLCWHQCVATLAFGVYAHGDWMGAYRWMSLAMPTASILFAVGTVEWADAVEHRITGKPRWDVVGWLVAAGLVGVLLPPNFSQTRDHALYNHNETPVMVRRRADYTKRIARRLFYEDPVVNLEMDQGAHLFWRPEYTEVDMAGLVDVAMARHRYDQDAFISQYVFDERKPTFAHVHGGWAKGTRLKEYPGFAELFELPAYDDVEMGEHRGVWARRSLLFQARFPTTANRRIQWTDGLVLEGVELPAPTWGTGRYGYLEIGVTSRPRTSEEAPTLVAFITGHDRVRTWSLPLGQGLVPIEAWRPGETFVGRYPLRVPDDLPLGVYDLGLVAFDGEGVVLPIAADSALPPTAVVGGDEAGIALAQGEVRFTQQITVVAGDRIDAMAEATRDAALTHARAGRCDAAESKWIVSKRHVPYLYAWQDDQLATVGPALGQCWAKAAASDPEAAADHLTRAHRWDPYGPALVQVGEAVGDRLWEDGVAAREARDWPRAYQSFSTLLRFQPWRSWARRYAEEARDHVLDLD